MFGLFDRSDDAPAEYESDIDIARPLDDVFDLLDMDSPRNALAARGYRVWEDADIARRYHAVDPNHPDLQFIIDVEAAERPARFIQRTSFPDGRAEGALVCERSVYTLTPMAAADGAQGACRVNLKVAFTLVPGLSRRRRSEEETMLMIAVYNDLSRLKVHAEKGAEAAKTAGFLEGDDVQEMTSGF